MGASFYNLAAIQHKDLIGGVNGRQFMRHDDQGFVLRQRRERLLQGAVIAGVKGGGCLVQQDDRRVFQNGAGNRHALTFAA